MMRYNVTLTCKAGDVVRVVVVAPNTTEARVEALRRSREYGYPLGYWWVYSCRHA